MLRKLLPVLLVALTLVARAQDCSCPPGLEHLCRCNILIDQRVAEQQLAYLSRLMTAEFEELLVEVPLSAGKVAPPSAMMLRGEAAQGYIDGEVLVVNGGMRRDQALMVLAHELGHAWHFASRPDSHKVQDFLVEGFAEWVAFHLLKRAGLTEFSYRIKTNPDRLYGEAFRWFAKLEQEYGRGAVLHVMLNWVDVEGHRS